MFVRYAPEVGNDLVTAIGDLLVLLGSALGDLESVLGIDGVARVGAATDLAAVGAVAENLNGLLEHGITGRRTTYTGFAVALHLVADIAAHASSGRHLGLRWIMCSWLECWVLFGRLLLLVRGTMKSQSWRVGCILTDPQVLYVKFTPRC